VLDAVQGDSVAIVRNDLLTSGQTGLIEAAWLVGTLGVSLIVARVGTWLS